MPSPGFVTDRHNHLVGGRTSIAAAWGTHKACNERKQQADARLVPYRVGVGCDA